MAAPKMKSSSRFGMNVKGMQNIAIIRSLTARERRKELVTVRIRLFTTKTTMMSRLPKTLSRNIREYSSIRTESISEIDEMTVISGQTAWVSYCVTVTKEICIPAQCPILKADLFKSINAG